MTEQDTEGREGGRKGHPEQGTRITSYVPGSETRMDRVGQGKAKLAS